MTDQTPRRLSDEHRAKIGAAHLGRPKSSEHRAAISAGLKRAAAEGRHHKARHLMAMTPEERTAYKTLIRKGGYRMSEALTLINRGDLA